MKLLIAHVSGNIAGVGYSSLVVTLAGTLDLKGYIETLSDGREFIIAEGPKEDLEKFVRAIRIDNAKIEVKEILIDYREPTGEFDNFHKIVSSQEEGMQPDKNASEMRTLNFLEAPDRMERAYPEICTPNHNLRKAGIDLERQEESPRLCNNKTRAPESCKP